MRAKLPLRLLVLIGAVENAVSGNAMRPMDVLRSRKGLRVEIGNTDAEGRLVLCDLLQFAAEQNPAMILDAATLTGAARVALGPDLPALFSNDDALSERLLAAGSAVQDPLWRLPLHDGYDSWLDSPFADLSNVSQKPMAGAVTAALFLRRLCLKINLGCILMSMPGTILRAPVGPRVAKHRQHVPFSQCYVISGEECDMNLS